MQVFRLVEPGRVDKIIAFDSLPKSLLDKVRRGVVEGFPRHWKDFLGVNKEDKDPRPFYFLEYNMINADKERWQEICNYIRGSADRDFRLLDKIEDMAVPLAPDSYSQITLEPEDIPVIPLPGDKKKEAPVKEVKKEEAVIEEEIKAPVVVKRRGRPKKEVAAVS